MFTNVIDLKFYQSLYDPESLASFNNQTPKFSSTLVELHIYVYCFADCLYLLDGCLNQLRTFFVTVRHILPRETFISNTVSYDYKENRSIF